MATEPKHPWLKEFKERRERVLPLCAAEWKRALHNQEFASGLAQWSEMDRKIAEEYRFACLTIPEIAPIIDTAAGRQILSRFERVYVPYSSELADWAELVSIVDKAIMQDADADQEESEAFRDGPCIQGLSCIRWSYDTDTGKKRIRVENVPLWQVLWPIDEARRMNLVDRRWQIYGEWYPIEEAKTRWPEHAKHFATIRGTGWPRGKGDTSSRIEWQGQPGTTDHGPLVGSRQKMVWVEHYEYVQLEDVYRVHPLPESQGEDPLVFDEGEYEKFAEEWESAHGEAYPDELVTIDSEEVYRWARLAGDRVLAEGKITIQDWTFEFITGTRHPKEDRTRWLAMVDRLKDSQKWLNSFLSAMARIFQANPKGTLVTERGVFKNRAEAARQWAGSGSILEVERGRMSGPNKPFEFLQGQNSPAFRMAETLMGYAKEALPRLVGFNPGALGQLGPDLRRISGEVLRGVQDAAVAGNAGAYDAHSLYRRRGGRKLLKMLKAYFEPEDIQAIVGDKAFRVDPTTGQEQSIIPPKRFWDPTAWKAIHIAEAGPTPDQKTAQWDGLVKSGGLQFMMTPHPITGLPLLYPEDIAEMMPALSEARRDKIISRHQQALEAAQQAQQQGVQQPMPPDQQPVQ